MLNSVSTVYWNKPNTLWFIITSDGEKYGFFYALGTAYDISLRNDIKIVLRDFNAQVGNKVVNFSTNGK
jgi:hypothetical protein